MSEQYGIDIFAEIFPVQLGALPRLFSYKLDIRGGDFSTIGGKLSYRLRKKFPGHWIWTRRSKVRRVGAGVVLICLVGGNVTI